MPKRVLLIDYEPRSVERLQGLLSAEYQVEVARDGEEGLATFTSSPRFDAVLLAGMLPRLASGEVVREIRRKGGAMAPPILLMVSGYKGNNTKADAQRVGAFDLLVKPFTDEQLSACVRGALEATDIGAKTMRIPTIAAAAGPELTASDIFSDVLRDVAATEAPARPAPAPPPAAKAAAPAAPADVEERLRDTLSGLLGARPTMKAAAPAPERPPEKPPATAPERPGPPAKPAAPPPAAAAPAAPAKKFSSGADIDRMISDTLSGLPAASRPRGPSEKTPPPAVKPPSPPRVPPPAAPPAPPRAATPPPAAARPAPPVSPPPPAPRPTEAPAVSGGAGPDRFGQYEILERIGSGGMAELYKARRSGVEGFEKIVAIKKILPHLADNEGFITMFADEAKLAAQLNHPNIVHIYDLGKIEGGGYFIAMEHVEGRDLRAILDSARELSMPLPVPLAVYIASKIASALDYAHRRRDSDGRDLHIVHRDVSPQNILISYEGDIKLCDFGIAKAASKVSQTESGALKGKIQYMSPEQAWGKPIDRRSDLFSLGAVLYELLTEQRLFGGDSDLHVLEKVREAAAPPPSDINGDVPKPLDGIVLKALARDAEERYANASDLLRDLEQVLYSYSPAPGSADLAIFLHRLQAEESAVAEAKAREAARAVPEAEVEAKPRRAKAAPVARRTTTTTKAPEPGTDAGTKRPPAAAPPPAAPSAPPPAVFGSYAAPRGEGEGGSRTGLFVAIAVAVVLVAAGAFWMLSRKSSSARPAPQPTAAPATPVPVAAAVPTPAPTAIDPKKVEEEVQRQLAQKKKELAKAAEAEKRKQTAAAASAPPAPAAAAPEPTAAPPPTAVPTPVPAEPTEVPTEPPPPPPTAAPRLVPAAQAEPELKRGDLVGPGPGVVEPELASSLQVSYPEMARQQRVSGKVVVLVLVDENGRVVESRLQQGVAGQKTINDAVLSAVRRAKFRPASKNGVAVKMWRPVVVDVKP